MTRRLLVVVGLLSATAWADWPQLSASLGYESQIFTSRGWDLVDKDDVLPGFRVAGSATLPAGVGAVDLEAAWLTSVATDAAHGAVSATLWLRGVELGATWRYPLYKHLHPYAHLGAGWDWATLTLFSESRLTQTVSNLSGNGLLGVQVPLQLSASPRHPPTLILDVGVGYVLRPAYAFDRMGPAPVANPGPDPIGAGAVNLGTLPMSGITWRLLASFRI